MVPTLRIPPGSRRRTTTQLVAITVNLTVRPRLVVENGRQYLVAPVTMIVPGVLNGSKGALAYYPVDIGNSVPAWNGVMLTVNHPYDPLTGEHLSARDPGVWDRQGIGQVRNARQDSQGKLKAEGWFDVDRTNAVDGRIINALRSGQPMELSTGLYTTNVPAPPGATLNGRPYDYVAKSYKPDHLAILPDQVGACSRNDGCGVLVNAAPTTPKVPEPGGTGQSPRPDKPIRVTAPKAGSVQAADDVDDYRQAIAAPPPAAPKTPAVGLTDNPAVSEAQRRFLYSQKGADWVKAHEFDNKGELPEHVDNEFDSDAQRDAFWGGVKQGSVRAGVTGGSKSGGGSNGNGNGHAPKELHEQSRHAEAASRAAESSHSSADHEVAAKAHQSAAAAYRKADLESAADHHETQADFHKALVARRAAVRGDEAQAHYERPVKSPTDFKVKTEMLHDAVRAGKVTRERAREVQSKMGEQLRGLSSARVRNANPEGINQYSKGAISKSKEAAEASKEAGGQGAKSAASVHENIGKVLASGKVISKSGHASLAAAHEGIAKLHYQAAAKHEGSGVYGEDTASGISPSEAHESAAYAHQNAAAAHREAAAKMTRNTDDALAALARKWADVTVNQLLENAADNQSRHLESGQYLPTKGSSQTQVHGMAVKGARSGDTPNELGTDEDDDNDEGYTGTTVDELTHEDSDNVPEADEPDDHQLDDAPGRTGAEKTSSTLRSMKNNRRFIVIEGGVWQRVGNAKDALGHGSEKRGEVDPNAEAKEKAKPLYEGAWRKGTKTGTDAVRVLSGKQIRNILDQHGHNLHGGNPLITGIDRGELSGGGAHASTHAISPTGDGRYTVTKLVGNVFKKVATQKGDETDEDGDHDFGDEETENTVKMACNDCGSLTGNSKGTCLQCGGKMATNLTAADEDQLVPQGSEPMSPSASMIDTGPTIHAKRCPDCGGKVVDGECEDCGEQVENAMPFPPQQQGLPTPPPAHAATTDAFGASAKAGPIKPRGPAMGALQASHDGDSDQAADQHEAAAEQHEDAATDARKDGDFQGADANDQAAALHRKAASMHAATVTNTEGWADRVLNEHDGHYFGDKALLTGAESSKDAQEKSEVATKRSTLASKAGGAERRGAEHAKAAQAHGEAQQAHMKAAGAAKSAGKDSLATKHGMIAREHGEAANAHAAKSKELSTNMTTLPPLTLEQRDRIVNRVTANCGGSDADKGALHALSDSALKRLARNAKAEGSNADVIGDDDEMDAGDDDNQTADPNYKEKTDTPGQTGVTVKKGTQVKNFSTLLQTHGSEEDKAAWNNALAIVHREKQSIVGHLTANVADDRTKGRLAANLMRKSLDELREMTVMVPAVSRPRPMELAPVANYLGAAAPLYPTANAGPSSTSEEMILALPTMNWGKTGTDDN